MPFSTLTRNLYWINSHWTINGTIAFLRKSKRNVTLANPNHQGKQQINLPINQLE